MMPVQVVGLGMSPADLTPQAREIIQEAQVLVGGRRLLSYFPDHPALKISLGKDPEGALREVPALAESRRVVVLASGDPNFYGIGALAVKILGAGQVAIHPNITAVQAAAARLKLSWHDAQVLSLHGRAWEHLAQALPGAKKLMIYTDPEHTPGAIARFLLERGLSQTRLWILEDLGQDTERVSCFTPAEAQDREFSSLNLVVLLFEADEIGVEADLTSEVFQGRPSPLHLGLPEEALAHQGGLITKAEVRAVVLAKLELYPGQLLWDVGAGCGSVGLEASLLMPGGKIFAIEQDPARAAQITANRDKFGVPNLEVVHGRAPACLAGLPSPQRVFVGGGGPDLGAILQEALRRLDKDGKVVLTASRLETLETAKGVLEQGGWQVEVTQIQVSRSRPLAGGSYLQALNPVWIVTALKR
ncbi:MAG: precorrin-6y C5,15-methyltransferase (decarboxylating) subunit CbiE [Thermodesulfobacteriota bacterium]